jgi:poly(A) polymerase
MTAPATRAVIAALQARGGPDCARFVGGCVRDSLLDRGGAVADVDIATTLTPPQVIEALNAAGLRAIPTGVEHGTVTALSDSRPFEITTLRRDVETDGRRAVVAFTTDWAEDAQRRDFRLNALYAEPDGALHDPTGGGLEDVAARRIVFVGDAETRIREDALRILRFFRFLARVGEAAQADAAGLAACAKLKGLIEGLSGERIQQEMLKLLAAPDPLPALRLMAEAGALQEALPGVAGLDRLEGLLRVEAALGEPGDSVLRLAALLPDEAAALAVAARLRLSNADKARLRALRAADLLTLAPTLPAEGLRRLVYRRSAGAVGDALRLAWAGADDPRWAALVDLAQSWTPPTLPITGAEIMALGAPQGPLVGVIRQALEDWWVDADFQPSKADALERAAKLAADLTPR